MPNIRKSLLQFVFSGSSMRRWNDKLRPTPLLEVDKQAHKMMVAWLLFMVNSRTMVPAERLSLAGRIVEGGLFDYFYRLVITDIKPPIFYQIKHNPDHYRKLTGWVLEQLEHRVRPLGPEFWGRLCARLSGERERDLADHILDASHLYASSWEFNLIKGVNPWSDEIAEVEQSFGDGLEIHADMPGMAELLEGTRTVLGRFAHLCGHLRFQTRWSQTPRIPETSVLGHLFIVAAYGYFFSLAVDACPARAQNNFFAGLFHDLPELLTRDIISPVKKSVAPIGDLIKEYEDREMERRVLGPLVAGGHPDIAARLDFFLGREVGSEFETTVTDEGRVRRASFEEVQERYNHDRFDAKDGTMLKICDSLAAFLEAYTAVRNGMASDQFQQAMWRIRKTYQNVSLGEDLHVGALLADFD
ncbi:MAG: HD domain-containing protein [Thermodesulfobacteriota bacterium]